jgi:hypothetical protein
VGLKELPAVELLDPFLKLFFFLRSRHSLRSVQSAGTPSLSGAS